MEEEPRMKDLTIGKFQFKPKGRLKKHFSYRCANYHPLDCKYLLSVPMNSTNYDPTTMECIGLIGAYRASTEDHNLKCRKKQLKAEEPDNKTRLSQAEKGNSDDIGESERPKEWKSDINDLRDFIRDNIKLRPKAIQAAMRRKRQFFTLVVIKENKSDIMNEMFPKDRRVAFHPTNCLIYEAEDNFRDNLFRRWVQMPNFCKGKSTSELILVTQEFVILTTNTMLFQMQRSLQWYVDGTFAVSPVGFQQLIVILVLLPDLNLFFPACYILATNKTQRLYENSLKTLSDVAEDEGFILEPKTIMSDFELGLQNAIKKVFKISDDNGNGTKLVGCFFHYVKALISRAKVLGFITRKSTDKKALILIGLFKIMAHCSLEKRLEFFKEIEEMYASNGAKFKTFLTYHKRNWLSNSFLEAYKKKFRYSIH